MSTWMLRAVNMIITMKIAKVMIIKKAKVTKIRVTKKKPGDAGLFSFIAVGK